MRVHMKLSECLVNLDYECLKGNVDNVINDVVYDSRKANADNAFICIVGAVTDGHKYISATLDKGCKVFVVEKDMNDLPELTDRDVTVIKVKDTRIALSYMSVAIFDYPAKKLKTVGNTGTKGKTTTTFM